MTNKKVLKLNHYWWCKKQNKIRMDSILKNDDLDESAQAHPSHVTHRPQMNKWCHQTEKNGFTAPFKKLFDLKGNI